VLIPSGPVAAAPESVEASVASRGVRGQSYHEFSACRNMFKSAANSRQRNGNGQFPENHYFTGARAMRCIMRESVK